MQIQQRKSRTTKPTNMSPMSFNDSVSLIPAEAADVDDMWNAVDFHVVSTTSVVCILCDDRVRSMQLFFQKCNRLQLSTMNCLHFEMRLKQNTSRPERFVWLQQNSFKTVLKLFCFSFISLCGQFNSHEMFLLSANWLLSGMTIMQPVQSRPS